MKNISIFPNKIVRIPFFSLNEYKAIPTDVKELDTFIDALFYHEKFSEAVYLASPVLHEEWEKIVESGKERGKINESILKYYLRAISNTVPFGLFTSYSILEDEPKESKAKDYERFSNLDMEYLLKLLHHLNQDPIIKNAVTYRKNNSIYKVGEKYRYIEPKYVNDKISYTLASIDSDELIDYLLQDDREEITLTVLKEEILNLVEGVTEDEVAAYLDELIQSGIYLSSLEVCLNQPQFIQQIVGFYEKNKAQIDTKDSLKNIFDALRNVDTALHQLDDKVFNSKAIYDTVFSELNKIGIPYEQKYVINSNLKRNNVAINEKDINQKLQQFLSKLSKISHSKIKRLNNLEIFKQNFYNRYEDQEVKLMDALDNELGIGYLSQYNEDVLFSDLLDDITIAPQKKGVTDRKIEPQINNFWLNLIMENADKRAIDLDKVSLDVYQNEKPIKNGAFSIAYTYANDKIYLKYASGATATNLIGRFGNNDSQMQKVIDEITTFEQTVNKDRITAEIIHLPSNRTGNVLIRNVDREAEISLISRPSGKRKVIDINDLYLSIKNNRIVLRSGKYKKEVIPYLSSAQNFHFNSLPAYHLLCDLQIQDRYIDYSINFGGFNIDDLDYCPRLVFGEKLVVRNAQWRLKKENYKSIEALQNHLETLQVPQFVYIVESTEEKMIIDRKNPVTLAILWNELKKNGFVQISECVYDLNKENEVANENIAFVKSQRSANVLDTIWNFSDKENQNVERAFIYGDEWMYFKLYTGRVISDVILTENIQKIVTTLTEQKIIDKWFFIRYTDPDFHLRVRLHLTDNKNYDMVTKVIHQELKTLVNEGKVWKLDVSTYKREIERYHWKNIDNSENIFSIDSDFTLKLMRYLKEANENRTWLFILKSIDDFFNAFQISLEERHQIIEKMYHSFWVEHGEVKSVRKDINAKFRKHTEELTHLFHETPADLQELYQERLSQLTKIQFVDEVTTNMTDLLWSYIHMHVNRFIPAHPRSHELIMYGILERFYSKEIGMKKYNQKLVTDEAY